MMCPTHYMSFQCHKWMFPKSWVPHIFQAIGSVLRKPHIYIYSGNTVEISWNLGFMGNFHYIWGIYGVMEISWNFLRIYGHIMEFRVFLPFLLGFLAISSWGNPRCPSANTAEAQVDELLRENAGMAQQEQGLSRPEIGWGVQIMWLVATDYHNGDYNSDDHMVK